MILSPLALALWLTFAVLSLSLLLSLVRAIRGPTLPDRVVALDLIMAVAVAFAAAYAVFAEDARFLDFAIALALIAFLSTLAFARYLEWRGEDA
ncbi:monovalent cation/H+ antiporter complex subunit F [Thermus sediminis]|uniref:monovalent cation/H+ antiporter complex subunit F n=1 Tax=Thermus sediminis TaxID=1761908 RepID=UPI000E3E8243|nr:monovalent cation/H+ antiporter complex subunit F [Thermus sediminis]